jgi:hypothetical protein
MISFPTETFGDMFFYMYILGTLVDVRFLELHFGAVFGVLLTWYV